MSHATTTVPVNEVGHEAEGEPARAWTPSETLRDLFAKKRQAIQAVCTPTLGADRLIKLFGAAASRNPKLLRCTPISILDAVMKMAELGLSPGPLGEVYLIPYENRKLNVVECQLIIGYRGMVTLARRSGQIATIAAVVVREGDEFTLAYTEAGTQFRHTPKMPLGEKVLGVWAMARFKDGGNQFDFMDRTEVDAIRSRSRAAGAGPWVTDFNEMAKKTVLRRLCKLLPMTPELESAIAIADRTEFDLAGADEEPQVAANGHTLASAIDSLKPKPDTTGAPAGAASPATITNGQSEAGSAPAPTTKETSPEEAAEFLKGMEGVEPEPANRPEPATKPRKGGPMGKGGASTVDITA